MHFITDFRYVTALDSRCSNRLTRVPIFELTVVEGTYDATLAKLLTSLGAARVGVRSRPRDRQPLQLADGDARAARRRARARCRSTTWSSVSRRRKDEYELAMLRESARLLSAVATGVFDEVDGADGARGRAGDRPTV